MITPLPKCIPEAITLQALADANVKATKHPTADLWIYNYTAQAQWNGILKTEPLVGHMRGLIVDAQGDTIARGFPKFFNLGEQPEVDATYLGKPFRVEEKVDGSLGILYHDGQDYAIATRGSFASEQAVEATRMLREKYRGWLDGRIPKPAYTVLFEIVYPENRIVVDYADRRDLVLLGAINIDDCHDAPSLTTLSWPGPKSGRFESNPSMGAADIASHLGPQCAGQEGFVLTYPDGHRVKVKLAEYLRLHRIVTGCNERSVWEALRTDTLDTMLNDVPDEFYRWVETTAARIRGEYQAHCIAAAVDYLNCLPHKADRKTFAEHAKKTRYPPVMFAWLDEKREHATQAHDDNGNLLPRTTRSKADRVLWALVEPSGAKASPFAARADS